MLKPRPPHDPHAHFVVPPGNRRIARVKLQLVGRAEKARRKRPSSPGLSLVSLLDVMMVTTLVLLSTARAPVSGCGCIDWPRIAHPSAWNGAEILDAPVVKVGRYQIALEGTVVGSSRAIEDGGRVVVVEELERLLEAKRSLALQVRPGEPPPERVILEIDREVPSVVVKSVVRTAARSGMPKMDFLVTRM